MELILPKNYAEIKQEEMIYLDGGDAKRFSKNVSGLLKKLGINYAIRQSAGLPTNAELLKMTWQQASIFFPSFTAKLAAMTGNPVVIGVGLTVGALGAWAMWNKRIFY